MDDIRPRIPAVPVRFLDQLRQHIRDAGLAYRTEQTYLYWVKRFINFHGKRHPKDMDMACVEAFLSHLAGSRECFSRHADITTTEIYTHVLNRGGKGVRSPADSLAASADKWTVD